MLVKAYDDNLTQWPQKIPQTLFADHVTTNHVIGFSIFYLIYEVHPVLLFNLTEATFMIDVFTSGHCSCMGRSCTGETYTIRER